jgi:serine/threonine protein kinase/tetratricopeptide (TPR) repeat protein
MTTETREEWIIRQARERPAAERPVFLDGACAGEVALRERLEALLAARDQTTQATEPEAARPTIKLDLADAPDEAVGQTLGRYKLLERVGEGGCGVVYVAEQTEPVRRRVALKVIKLGMDTKQVVARFEAERQALAMMDHPNIAKVLDAGTTDVGRPFFVMELVRGIRITDYCDQANLTTKERLDLFIKVCHAIQHAHQKGIIHRDIKPSNILVTLHDGLPVPKVIDFGIAKATEGRLTDNTVYTQLHQFIGTPAYMSPEQAEMSGLDIDTRSDIYSLGVLLYELLAGSTPFDAKELMASGIDAMRKTIREKEPVRPSTKLSQTLVGADVGRLESPASDKPSSEEEIRASSRRLLRIKETITLLKGDLDWIVMKCLEKDRARRYETATGLAADIKRHLNNEPVTARPPSAAYKFQKAFRRNKLVFAAGTAVGIALALGMVGTSIGLVRADHQRRAAEASRKLAEQRFQIASRFVQDVFRKVAPKFSGLIGATEAKEELAQTSVTFLRALGDAAGSDETFQKQLATLYLQMANALGSPYSANTIGDYSNALSFVDQSLAIIQNLQKQHPSDEELLQQLIKGHDAIGSILGVLGRPDEALEHHRRSLETVQQLHDQHPDDVFAERWLSIANFRIGNDLMELDRAQEALEKHYLPYGKQWLERSEDATISSDDAHMCGVAHRLVGGAEMALNQPAKALTQFQQSQRWAKYLADREPNEARYARDLGGIPSKIGAALIDLGRFDEGLTNLQTAVHFARTMVARDSMNGSSQEMLIECLQLQAKGFGKVASSPATPPARQSELWQQAVQSLTRCEVILAAPELARIKPQLRKTAKEITEELNVARAALEKTAADAGSQLSKP